MTAVAPLACSFCRIALAPPAVVCPRDGHSGEPVMWDAVPNALAKRFRVLEPFARGGTGSIYLADESESGRRGLLKVLSGVPKAREPERARLRRELGKQATLNPGRLVVPSASGETEGVTWLFRPWLDGVSLHVRLHQADKLGVEDALAISAQLAIGLDELHRAGLLHRDLKPGHVFLPTSAQPPVRAQLIEAGVCATLVRPGNSTIFGTPGYVAPEQLNGKLVSFRSDLYSLGCVMYEMLVGRPPFAGENDQAVLAAQLAGDRPELPDGLPDGIGALVRSLLAREPQERPFSAQKLRRTLDPYAPDGTPMTRQPTSTFATLSDPEKQAEKPAAALPVSVPPPPPPAALRTRSGAAPRPTTRGMAPPPPPRSAHGRAQDPSSIDVDLLEEMDAAAEAADDELAAPPPADRTQELGTEHLFDVRRVAAPSSSPPKSREDHTVPIRLEQVLAIAPARLRANSAPPPREPEPAREPEPLPEPAASELPPPKGLLSGFPQPALQLEQLASLPSPAALGPEQTVVQSSLFGQLPGPADDPADDPLASSSHAAGDDDKTTAFSSDRPPAAPQHAPNSGDDAPTIAALPAFAHSQDAHGADDHESSEPRALRDTLRPFLNRPLGEYRKIAFAASAALLLGLAVLGVSALVGDDDDERAEAQAARPAGVPTVEPVPAVEPAPSVTALAEPPAAAAKAPSQPAAAKASSPPPAPVLAPPQPRAAAAAPSPPPAAAPASDQPAKAAAAEPEPQASQGNARIAAAAPAQAAPEPVAKAAQPVAKAAQAEAAQAVPEAAAKPAQAAPEPEKSGLAKPEPAEKSPQLSARAAREERRRSRREQQERELAEKRAAKADAKARAAKAVDSSGAGRESKWAEARDQARGFYAAKQYKQAAQAYERAAQYDPTNAGTYAGLGAARLQAGDAKGAVAAYQRAIQLSPSSSGFHAALGRAYLATGDKAKAKAAYARALSLDPNNASLKSSLKELGG